MDELDARMFTSDEGWMVKPEDWMPPDWCADYFVLYPKYPVVTLLSVSWPEFKVSVAPPAAREGA